MPEYTQNDEVGDIGVDLVALAVKREFSWIFRRQPENDLGIDGQIETVDSFRQGTGRLIAVQIKTGDSFFKHEQKNGYIFYGKNKHLKYWLSHSLPVIITICNSQSGVCYWVEVTRTNIENTDQGWKILIPKKQTISSSNKYLLEEISQTPQHSDIIELLILKFLNDKYNLYSEKGLLNIFPDIITPAGFENFTYLGRMVNTDEFIYVGHYYNPLKDFDEDDLLDFIQWRDISIKKCSHLDEKPKIIILVISENEKNLKFSDKLTNIIRSTPDIEVSRLIYWRTFRMSGTRFFDLYEIDENDKPILIY